MATKPTGRTATMQIGELAHRSALTVDAIRFYEKRGLLPKPVRSKGRFRLYTDDDTERLRFIQQVQGLGFSLTEVRELVDLRARKVDACESVRQLLKGKLSDVRAKVRELEALESELIADLQKCNQELKHRRRHVAAACPVLEVEGVRK
jgi:MerR family mercuric resistance operon transcriptional regulator